MSTDTKTKRPLVPISDWIPVADAYYKRYRLVNNGIYTVDQVDISSFRWVDTKDLSKGRECRVLAIKGIHPDMEVGTKYVKKAATAAAAGNSSIIGGVIGDLFALAIVAIPLYFIYRVISFIYLLLYS